MTALRLFIPAIATVTLAGCFYVPLGSLPQLTGTVYSPAAQARKDLSVPGVEVATGSVVHNGNVTFK
ncbi:hypothetical protein J7643_10065 [bacterium]|nr:hypothetical protein [bacterium]